MTVYLKSNVRLTGAPLFADLGGLIPSALPTAARMDFAHEDYRLRGAPMQFADMLRQTSGATATYYDRKANVLRSVASGVPSLWSPMGDKGLQLNGQEDVWFSGGSAGTFTHTFASHQAGRKLYLGAWGAKVSISGDVTVAGGGNTADTFAPLEIVLNLPPGQTTGTFQVVVSPGIAWWGIAALFAIDGVGGTKFADRAYTATAALLAEAKGARTIILRARRQFIGSDSGDRVIFEIKGATQAHWLGMNSAGHARWRAVNASGALLTAETISVGPAPKAFTAALSIDPAQGRIGVACEGRMITTWGSLPAGFDATAINFGRIPFSNTTPRSMIQQFAILEGAADADTLAKLSGSFA